MPHVLKSLDYLTWLWEAEKFTKRFPSFLHLKSQQPFFRYLSLYFPNPLIKEYFSCIRSLFYHSKHSLFVILKKEYALGFMTYYLNWLTTIYLPYLEGNLRLQTHNQCSCACRWGWGRLGTQGHRPLFVWQSICCRGQICTMMMDSGRWGAPSLQEMLSLFLWREELLQFIS